MNSVIVSDYGVALAKTGDRLVVHGPKPRLELIEGGPQLFLPLGLNNHRPAFSILTSEGEKHPSEPLRHLRHTTGKSYAPKASPERIELPLFSVGHIVIASSGVSISTDLIEACCERGIRLSFLTRAGKPYAMLSSPMLTATVLTRREQLAAYHDSRGVEFAKAIVRGKLRNQAALLRYFGKYLRTVNPEAFARLCEIAAQLIKARNRLTRLSVSKIDDARETLLAAEVVLGGITGRGFDFFCQAG
jgi:hypothetical protein